MAQPSRPERPDDFAKTEAADTTTTRATTDHRALRAAPATAPSDDLAPPQLDGDGQPRAEGLACEARVARLRALLHAGALPADPEHIARAILARLGGHTKFA